MPRGDWQRPSRPQLEDRDWLFHEYVTRQQTAAEIAQILGVSTRTVLVHLRRNEIPLRRGGRPALTEPTRQEIISLYKEGLGLAELAARFATSTLTVTKLLRAQGVPRRRSGQTNRRKQSKAWPTLMQDGWLLREYVAERKSISVIAGQLGCGTASVRRALGQKDIPVRVGQSRRRATAARALSHRHGLQLKGETGGCALCQAPDELEIHHRDGDRANDARENLIVLCRDCHVIAEWFIRPVHDRLAELLNGSVGIA